MAVAHGLWEDEPNVMIQSMEITQWNRFVMGDDNNCAEDVDEGYNNKRNVNDVDMW